jgi:hypothetical protein
MGLEVGLFLFVPRREAIFIRPTVMRWPEPVLFEVERTRSDLLVDDFGRKGLDGNAPVAPGKGMAVSVPKRRRSESRSSN